MPYIDTHTHIYLEQFNQDRAAVVDRAKNAQVSHLLMPNIDSHTAVFMMKAARDFPDTCLPMMGLHPTSIKATWKTELEMIEGWFNKYDFVAVGETGMDLYWDQTYEAEQKESFARHIAWAAAFKLPLVIHSRNSLNEIFDVLEAHSNLALTGVFHCFPGTPEQAAKVLDMGFMLGIGGVVTYKNSLMADVVSSVGMEHIILETDAPFLSPFPHRGKRNESAFLPYIAEKIAALKGLDVEDVAQVTTTNASRLFGLKVGGFAAFESYRR